MRPNTSHAQAQAPSWTEPRKDRRLVGLIGKNIDTSQSRHLHNAAFGKAGLDWSYVSLPVPSTDELKGTLHNLQSLGFAGVNITMPFKEEALSCIDAVTPRAGAIGAINTVKVHPDGRLFGDNTDASGFLADLDARGIVRTGRQAVVLGAGGAARAVAFALALEGVEELCIINRTRHRAEQLAAELRGLPDQPQVHVRTWLSDVRKHAGAGALIVNCTSVGMQGTGTEHQMPWPSQLGFHPDQDVIDLVYAPLATPFFCRAQQDGARAHTGLGMLVQQAALAFAWWTDLPPPVETMAQALDTPLGWV